MTNSGWNQPCVRLEINAVEAEKGFRKGEREMQGWNWWSKLKRGRHDMVISVLGEFLSIFWFIYGVYLGIFVYRRIVCCVIVELALKICENTVTWKISWNLKLTCLICWRCFLRVTLPSYLLHRCWESYSSRKIWFCGYFMKSYELQTGLDCDSAI